MWIWIIIGFAVLVAIGGVALVVMRSANEKPNKKNHTQDQKDSEFVQRLCYLMKIVVEHSSSERRQSSTREVIRIGEEVHNTGGFRYMVKIHESVSQQMSDKIGGRLAALWKGIGDWRGV